jgi:cobyrinic acid a,c-diamide synthase
VDASVDADLAIIEGNRGLYDGMDPAGSFSSGELAKLLKSPVILSVDATKTTRTAAAQVLGCQTLDPEVPLVGVVLNRVAGSRHESILRETIEGICGIPVLGAIPRLPEDLFPERHLGLVPPQETDEIDEPLSRVQDVAERYLDLDQILGLAQQAPQLSHHDPVVRSSIQVQEPLQARIGVFRDAAFQFYYPENLEKLAEAGGKIVEISPVQDSCLPDVDALYLGGGFPETLASELSRNVSFMESVRDAAKEGLPIYAECGGAVYLGESLNYENEVFPLVGVLPVTYGFQRKPRGHGYTVVETVGENPFFPLGTQLRGHEFHYTYMLSQGAEELSFAFKMHRGYGYDGEHDGLCVGNVLASYTHLHALGATDWASALVRTAVRFKSHSSGEGPSSSAEDLKG